MNKLLIRKWASRALMAVLVMLFASAFAYTLPADFALLAAIDMATYVDALIGVYVLANVGRIKPMIAYLRSRAIGAVQRVRGRASRARNALKALPKRADNDDHPAPAPAMAA